MLKMIKPISLMVIIALSGCATTSTGGASTPRVAKAAVVNGIFNETAQITLPDRVQSLLFEKSAQNSKLNRYHYKSYFEGINDVFVDIAKTKVKTADGVTSPNLPNNSIAIMKGFKKEFEKDTKLKGSKIIKKKFGGVEFMAYWQGADDKRLWVISTVKNGSLIFMQARTTMDKDAYKQLMAGLSPLLVAIGEG